ncbi:MAG: HNH endonuclease [Streptomyces sp.]|nr:HNH endonuclease [Streptomyces sp.]
MISARRLLAWACEAQIVPVVFNDSGGILNYGRTRRFASPGQRLALAARDRGCSFPGCDRPPAWCEAHHILEWIFGGETNLDNLTLVCSYHHRNFAHAGWHAEIRDGVVWWTPPAWEDPERRPRRNTVHHLTKIEFRQPAAA